MSRFNGSNTKELEDKLILFQGSIESVKGPFVDSAVINKTLIQAIKKATIYGPADQKYYVKRVGRNVSGVWSLNIAKQSDNAVVCQLYTRVYTESSGPSFVSLQEVSGSGVTGSVLIDWSKIPTGTSIGDLPYEQGALELKNTEVKADSFIFRFSNIVNDSVKNAVKSLNLFNANKSNQYYVRKIDRNNSGGWEVTIADSSDTVVSRWYQSAYTEPSGIDTINLTAFGNSGITGIMTIDWTKIESGKSTGVFNYNQTGISYQSYRDVTNASLIADKPIDVDADAGTMQWYGDIVINGTIYPITNKSMTFTLSAGIKYIFYNMATSKIEIYLYDSGFQKANLYYLGALKADTGGLTLSIPYRIKKNGVWKTNVAKEEAVVANSYPSVYGMPRYEPTQNYVPNIPTTLNNVYYSGRWFPYNESSKDYMGVIQQGQEIYAKVSGTAQVTVNVLDKSPAANPAVLSVKVDDGDWVRYPVSGTSVQVATGLDTDEHYIRIMVSMKTDGLFNSTQAFYFGGLTVDAGGKISPIKPKNRVAYGVGDSITAGKDTLGTGNSAAEVGYISVLGDKLNTRIIRNAFSGTGLVNTNTSTNAINYVNKIKSDLVDDYDHRPDFIIVNEGQNDGGTTSTAFIDKYNELINRLKHKFPGVPIFCVVPFSQAFASSIAQVVTQNSKICILVPTQGWNLTFVDGTHPDANGSQIAGGKMADIILNYFKEHYFVL